MCERTLTPTLVRDWCGVTCRTPLGLGKSLSGGAMVRRGWRVLGRGEGVPDEGGELHRRWGKM